MADSGRSQPRDIPSASPNAGDDSPRFDRPDPSPGQDEIRRFSGIGNRMLGRLLPLGLLAAGALALVVTFAGLASLRDSRGGQGVPADAPAQVAEATETALLAWVGPDGDLVSAVLLGYTSPNAPDIAFPFDGPSTSVLVLSADMRMSPDQAALRDVWTETNDPMALAATVQEAFNIEVDHAVRFGVAELTQIVELAGTVEVRVEGDLVGTGEDGTSDVVFPEGELRLDGEALFRYAAWINPGGDRVGRFSRQRGIWDGLGSALSMVVASAPEGEADGFFAGAAADASEVGGLAPRFLDGLAAPTGQVLMAPLRAGVVPGSVPTFDLDMDAGRESVASAVPFPRPAPGQDRVAVRLIDASGSSDAFRSVRRRIVIAGGRVVSVGRFTRATSEFTRLVHHSEDETEWGEGFAPLIGVPIIETDSDLESPRGLNAFDFSVVVGLDLVQDGGE